MLQQYTPTYHMETNSEEEWKWNEWIKEVNSKIPIIIPEQPFILKDGKIELVTDKGEPVTLIVTKGTK